MKFSKYIPLLIVQFFLNSFCFAQWQNIDSLRKVLPALKDTERIDCLVDIGIHYLKGGNKDSTARYSDIIYNESKKINYVHGIAESYSEKSGFANCFSHDFPEMEKQAKEALKWFDKTSNKTRIEVVYLQAGAALFSQGRNDEAALYLEHSYYWAEKNGNKEWMFYVLGFKYENYRDIGDYEKAFDAFKKTQELNQAFYGKIDTGYENYGLAELQRRIGNYSIALNYYRKVIAGMDLNHTNIWFRVSYPELFALNGQFDSAQYYYNQVDTSKCSTEELRFYLVSLGEFYLLQKKYDNATSPLLASLQLHRKACDRTQINRSLIDIAQTYAALQKDKEATAYAREGLNLAIRSHSKQYIRDASQILYEIYQRNNQPDSAIVYYKQYMTQKEIVANDVVKGKFAAYNYEQQIGLLNKEKQLQLQKIEQSEQQKYFLVAGLVILLIAGVVLFRNISLKRKNEAGRRAIAEHKLQMQKLESEKTKSDLQQQAAELEMQALRSQMNPHFIFNSLNSINRFILQNDKAQASGYLTKFSKLVRMILQNSQAPLIPLESELESLELYLELEALRFDNHFAYNISISKEMDADILKVPPLIIQPYAENAIWHGLMHKDDKGNLAIDISQDNDFLFLKIKDDGIGRKQAAAIEGKSATKYKSMGLKITADRIAMMQRNSNGHSPVIISDLVDEDGKVAGTEVIIKLPLIYE